MNPSTRRANRVRRDIERVTRAAANMTAAAVTLRARSERVMLTPATGPVQPPPMSEEEATARLVARIDAELGAEPELEVDWQ